MDKPASVEKSIRRKSAPVKHVVTVSPKPRVEKKKPWNVSTRCAPQSNDKLPSVPNNTSLVEGMAAKSSNPTIPIINGSARSKSKNTTNKKSLTKLLDVESSPGERAGPGHYNQRSPVTQSSSSQRVNESLRADFKRLSTSVREDINSLRSNIEDLTRNVRDVIENQHIFYDTITLSNSTTPALSGGYSTPERATAQRTPSQGYRRKCTTRTACGTCGTCGTNLDIQHRKALPPIDQNDINGVVVSEHVKAPDASNDNNAEDHTAHVNNASVVTDTSAAGIATDDSSANSATVNSAASNTAAASAPDSATSDSTTGDSATGKGEVFFKDYYNVLHG